MPTNDQFEYDGLSVEHAADWNANDYHNRQQKVQPQKKQRVKPQGLGNAGRQTTVYDVQLENAKMKDWRERGLSNNKIIDN